VKNTDIDILKFN